jgi:hypothetical protein
MKKVVDITYFVHGTTTDNEKGIATGWSPGELFEDRVPIIWDKRLRECNYGNLTGAESRKVESLMLKSINKPFPNGESYKDVEKRIRNFLNDLLKNYSGKNIAIVAHRAPQLALEVILNKKSWRQAIKEDWRFKRPEEWKPGWKYKLEEGFGRDSFHLIHLKI